MRTSTFVGLPPAAPDGTYRLLAHLAALDRLLAEEAPEPACDRLEDRVGPDLARLLVAALTAGPRVRRDVA